MTQDDIIRMAQEAKMADACWQSEISILLLKRFAALIAAAEREGCAKICDLEVNDDPFDTGSKMAKYLAADIRARGQQ